jgi:putative phage-type endonuclease
MDTQELRYVPESFIEVIDTSTMSRQDWLALRRTGIGGSDVGSIVGVNRYRSAYELWLDKTGRIPDLDLSDIDAVHFGIVFEDAVADRFAYRTGFRVWNPHATFRDRERPWRLANPDRLMVDDNGVIGVLECKTTGLFAGDEWANNQIPESYELQAVHYAGVLGLPYAYLAVLIGGQRLEYRRVDVDPGYVADVDQVTATFWLDHVVKDEPPPVDHTEACTDVLVRLWEAQEGIAELGDDGLDAARRYRAALADEKRAGETKALAGNQLRAMLGPHTVGVADGRKIVTWSETTSRRFDLQAFSADHPDLFEAYRRPATQRTLRVPASVET